MLPSLLCLYKAVKLVHFTHMHQCVKWQHTGACNECLFSSAFRICKLSWIAGLKLAASH